jgi:hypothetical protein
MANQKKSQTNPLRGKASGRVGRTSKRKPTLRVDEPKPRKVMVIVHGAGNHEKDYYKKPLVEEMEKRLGSFDYLPVFYADWNQQVSLQSVEEETQAEKDFHLRFRQRLREQYLALPPSARPIVATAVADEDFIGGLANIGFIIKEASAYFFKSSVTRYIRDQVRKQLQAAMAYDEIVLVSHSMGTLITLDVLKESAALYNKVSYWFTTGCPLGSLRFLKMCDENLGAISPQTVKNWYNLYDTSDSIASAIGAWFPAYRIHDIFVEVANTMPEAHDYWGQSSDTLDMFANVMR